MKLSKKLLVATSLGLALSFSFSPIIPNLGYQSVALADEDNLTFVDIYVYVKDRNDGDWYKEGTVYKIGDETYTNFTQKANYGYGHINRVELEKGKTYDISLFDSSSYNYKSYAKGKFTVPSKARVNDDIKVYVDLVDTEDEKIDTDSEKEPKADIKGHPRAYWQEKAKTLEEAIRKNQRYMDASELLLTKFPETVREIKDDLQDLVNKSKQLLEAAQKSLEEVQYLLENN